MIKQLFNLKYCFVLVLLLCAACKPDEIPPTNIGTPVFNFEASGIEIIAGEEDFYLFTSFEKDSLNVFEFKGSFEKLDPDCGNLCTERLSITIRDAVVRPSNQTDIDLALNANLIYKQIGINTQDSLSYTLSATTLGQGPFNFKYQIDNEPDFQGVDLFSTTLNRLLSQPINQVRMEVTDGLGCVSYIEKSVGPQLNCSVDIIEATDTVNTDSILLIAQATGAGPFSYTWSNNQFQDSVFYPILPQQISSAEVTIMDSAQCSSKARVGIYGNNISSPSQRICSSTLNVSLDTIPGNSGIELSTVLIEYMAPDSTLYRSDLANQTLNSFFNITDIEDFDNNENGQATKKMQINFNCLLQSANGAILMLNNGTGTIGVAYPN